MLNSTITEEIQKLTPSEKIDLIEYTVSVFKKDLINQPEQKTNGRSLAVLARSIAEAGEQALKNGAPELPSDFATNHDQYLYGIAKK